MAITHNNCACDLGLLGLGVMGQNLALNIADRGYRIGIWNRTSERMDRFVERMPHANVIPQRSLKGLLASLSRPRRIICLVQAGEPVDALLARLLPLLEEGDTVVDGGNSWFEDTERRVSQFQHRKLRYLGMGISGGEKGARLGPSLMPGGDRGAYLGIREILESIAAGSDSGPCVAYVGPGGSGHFVKMVHNGIEYADMQLIAESYDCFRKLIGLDAETQAEIFSRWNLGRLESYLIDITASILRKTDLRTGRPLVDLVMDAAGQKGTGHATVRAALALGVPVPSICAAVEARLISIDKAARVLASKILDPPGSRPEYVGGREGDGKEQLIEDMEAALFASRISAFAQGMGLIDSASKQCDWDIDCAEIARIWKGGCIIRSRLLDGIVEAFQSDRNLPNLMISPVFASSMIRECSSWRRVVSVASIAGVPIPCLASSLAYFDGYRSEKVPQNLTQAQRDAFGAHTYQREDDDSGAFVHSDWLGAG